MANKHRPTTGPLTPVQRRVVMEILAGKTQRQVAQETGVQESYVSSELAMARLKMDCSTTSHAIGTMATALAYLEAAKLISQDVECLRASGSEVDDHVAYVLEELAGVLEERAAKLIPS